MFGAMPAAANGPLLQMKAGKMTLENTRVTADDRKGLLILRKSEDGLMHLIWKDRNAGTVVDDLIVFEGDATIRQIDECTDGFTNGRTNRCTNRSADIGADGVTDRRTDYCAN